MYNLGLEQDAASVSSRGTLAHSVSCRRHPFGTIAFTYHHQRPKRDGARVRLSAAPCKDVLHQVMARPLAQFVLGRKSLKELLRESFETDSLPQITKRANSDILVGRELIQALLLLGTQRRKRTTRMVVVALSSNVRRLQTHTSTRSGIWRSAVYPACNRRRTRPYYGSGMTRGAKSVDPEFAGAIVITRNPSVVEEVLELALAR